MPNILVVEDDIYLNGGLCALLKREGYGVSSADCRKKALEQIENREFDLLILDNMLPDGFGTDICREIRESGNTVPVLILSAMDDELQIVRGLDSGADDYVTKPFKLLELLSRVNALLRRRSSAAVRVFGNITVDTERNSVKKDGGEIYVTPTEFRILLKLTANSGAVVTRESLLRFIWDDNGNYIDDNTLSVHIRRLREKIGAEHIATVRGFGYKWRD